MHSLRRYKLARLLAEDFKGDRGAFLKRTGLSKGRLTQLLDPAAPFGDNAARNLEERLSLDPGFFDTMDQRTLQFAMLFEGLPEHQKAAWEKLAAMLSGAESPKPPPND